MNRLKVFLSITWLCLSTGYFFVSETITKLLFSGYDSVDLWLLVLVTGLVLILVLVIISYLVIRFKLYREK